MLNLTLFVAFDLQIGRKTCQRSGFLPGKGPNMPNTQNNPPRKSPGVACDCAWVCDPRPLSVCTSVPFKESQTIVPPTPLIRPLGHGCC